MEYYIKSDQIRLDDETDGGDGDVTNTITKFRTNHQPLLLVYYVLMEAGGTVCGWIARMP